MAEQKQEQVAIVTGANTGIGEVTALELAKKGWHVFVAGRNPEASNAAIERIKQQSGNRRVEYLRLDLSSLESVRACAKDFLDRGLPLQLLVNNAGTAVGSPNLLPNGVEYLYGVNQLGPFLFTALLLPRIKQTPHARIVILASRAHEQAKMPIDWNKIHEPSPGAAPVAAYGLSKLANIWWSHELARQLKESGSTVTSNCLHPGVVQTDIWRGLPRPVRWFIGLFMLSKEDGARTTLYCALAPELANVSGKYFDTSKEAKTHKEASNPERWKENWSRCVQLSGLTRQELDAAGLRAE